jgi:hypothetical protein
MKISMASEQFHHGHKLMWLDLERTGAGKKQYTAVMQSLARLKLNGVLFNHALQTAYLTACFACGESENRGSGGCAQCCPVVWGNPRGDCRLEGSPYRNWGHARTPKERKRWAGIIARLEWRKP